MLSWVNRADDGRGVFLKSLSQGSVLLSVPEGEIVLG